MGSASNAGPAIRLFRLDCWSTPSVVTLREEDDFEGVAVVDDDSERRRRNDGFLGVAGDPVIAVLEDIIRGASVQR